MEPEESHTSRHITKVSQQEKKKEIYPTQSLRPCLFWITTVENSSRDFFFVEPHSKRSPIFGVWPVVSPRPLFCVYFNYSLHFASKLQTPPSLHIPHSNHTSLFSLTLHQSLCSFTVFFKLFPPLPPLFRKLGKQ